MGFKLRTNRVNMPKRIDRLNELSYNLWWTWHLPARSLYKELDPVLWETVKQNPVLFLHRIEPERLVRAVADPAFLSRYDEVMRTFDAMLNSEESNTWLALNHPEMVGKKVAYFSAEFGLHPALPIYSGGLGVLAGDHIKEASDMGIPLTAVSLLYRQGYLQQRIDSTGWQQDVPAILEPDSEPVQQVMNADGSPLHVEIDLHDVEGALCLAVWQVKVGRVSLYLLDSDVEGNPDWTRQLSSRLYGGDTWHRLRQEIILGIGGVRLLRKLGIEPTYWHANEGHAALSMVERVREYVQQGMDVEEAKDVVARHTVFTTHTPVPAGHDIFTEEQIDKYFTRYWPELGMTRDEFYALGKHGDKPGFNFTALSMRLASHRNGVSEKHGDVSREMWYDIFPDATPETAPIRHITNGVHLRTWIGKHMREAYQLYQPQYWKEQQEKEHVWDTILNIPDEKFWESHMRAKQSLITAMAERSRARYVGGDFDAWQVLSSGAFQTTRVLTLGFARRFATYKRATLLFRDPDRLQRILTNPEFPVQLVFAGKAHPADDGGKQLIREIYMNARDSRFGGRIAFVEDYEMGIARNLVSGVDVWVNNPRYPLEASGTSGMKAAANGVPNFSILDGWWIEGFNKNPRNGWGIEPATHLDGDAQDEFEANAMYDMLENAIVPLYYKRDANGLPREWIKVMKEAIRTNAPKFSARRMLIDYVEQLYGPASRGDAE